MPGRTYFNFAIAGIILKFDQKILSDIILDLFYFCVVNAENGMWMLECGAILLYTLL